MNLNAQVLTLNQKGNDIKALHLALASLGLSVPPGEQQQALFGPGTNSAVVAFQTQHSLEPTGVVNADTARILAQAVDATTYEVSGVVYSLGRASIGGLHVQIVDKNVGQDIVLAEVVTDVNGRYQVRFATPSLLQRGKQNPDLQARIYLPPRLPLLGSQTFLGASSVRYDATRHETLNVQLPASLDVLPSEHESLTATLVTTYGGKLAELQESDERQDITYLANKSGWDARAIALAALADQFSQRAGQPTIDASMFYALFRAGLPANEDVLYHVDSATLTEIWNSAIEQGLIARSFEKAIPPALARFQALSSQRRLEGPPLAGVSSFKDMLVLSGLNEAQQQQFAALRSTYSGDLEGFWSAVSNTFGQNITQRLQVDGKLGALTINNVALMQQLHQTAGAGGLADPLQLVHQGYHRAEQWSKLLGPNIPVPDEIPGETPDAKQSNYASYLAAQVRLSYPTAAITQLISSLELPVSLPNEVSKFLTAHHGKFEIGVQPVKQYIARNKVPYDELVVKEIQRVQRVYQITPDDEALIGLFKRGIHSAYEVVTVERDDFVTGYSADVGGEENAHYIYDRAEQVHNIVVNVVLGYLTAQTAPELGVHESPRMIAPRPKGPGPANADDIIAYPTMESLFGSMDYCDCEHCRSILSPAAYLVDLLLFLDNPKGNATNPLAVLLRRRPDLQHLPLTCENTNTALPYIDIVNETLEYYIANETLKLSLDDYHGHDTQDDVVSEDLLASPQYVMDSAYTILRGARFPFPLPFHQPLESLRRYFAKFDVRLPLAMERLRKTDDLERGANAYAWRDILMEEVGLSRAEYDLLTTSGNEPEILAPIYGFPAGTTDSLAIAGTPAFVGLANAKHFARRVGTTYEELIAVLSTRFVNPNYDLLPKLQQLGLPFSAFKALKDGHRSDGTPFTAADFIKLLPAGLDPAAYGGKTSNPSQPDYGAIAAWVKSDANYARIMGLITLAIPAGPWRATKNYLKYDCVRPARLPPSSTLYFECTTQGVSAVVEPTAWPSLPGHTVNDGTVVWTCRDEATSCSFDDFAFRYSDPDAVTQDVATVVYVRLLRFIRLWKKLGWTIEQTDAVICSLYENFGSEEISTVVKLDLAFLGLLPRLGIVLRTLNALELAPKRDLLPLLACWGNIGTYGPHSLYRQMFHSPAALRARGVFDDDGYGEFLQNKTEKLIAYTEALRAAFGLTDVEFNEIIAELGFDANHVEVPYTQTAPVLDSYILETAPDLEYDHEQGTLGYTGALSSSRCTALKAAPGATPPFQAAVDALYAANQALLTPLTLSTISSVYRWGWLARKLKISVRELRFLRQVTGLDPFVLPTAVEPAILRLVALVESLKERSLKPTVALYLVWNQDLSSKSGPDAGQVADFARTLRSAFAAVESDFAVQDDPDGTLAQSRMALVYGTDVASFFFGLLNNTLVTEAKLEGVPNDSLEQAVLDTAPGRIGYDFFRKKMSFTGVLSEETATKLKNIAGTTAEFVDAVDRLFQSNQQVVGPFFDSYPELRDVYDHYVAGAGLPEAERRTILLKEILPDLIQRRKAQQALQAVAAVAAVDSEFAATFLNPPGASKLTFPLHADKHDDQPALNDLLALEINGLSVRFFANDTAAGTEIPSGGIAKGLNYAVSLSGKPDSLPTSPTPNAAISGLWTGYLEAPASGFYNFAIECDQDAQVTLTLDGNAVALSTNGTLWTNDDAIEMKVGRLYSLELKVEKVRQVLRVQWEWSPKGDGRSVIPSRYLYPATIFEEFRRTYIRFLKVASLASGLLLTGNELAHFATRDEYRLNADGVFVEDGQGWLNVLPVAGDAHLKQNGSLLTPLVDLLNFSRMKAELSPDDESLLTILQDPASATAKPDSLLFALTRWERFALYHLLQHFFSNRSVDALAKYTTFRRIYNAFVLMQSMGIGASALLRATTNEPDGETVRTLHDALRARYDSSDWREVVRPINDELRSLQRDALVAYILHEMRSNSESAHIDTPDKLFEYFLMDVQMDPCMQTSRVRHALSSVQLFVERCLMHLEKNVAPNAINAERWSWMKRYRVWEANRKVYLFPENWLEPELRDDKSPVFKEIESQLMQSDITEEAAAAAMLTYLRKLEEVAKLEPCAIHHAPASATGTAVDHVIARTAGSNRTYYYRRFEYGSWTPWEQIKLDIDDNPVVLYIWKGRVLLFWLRILKQMPMAGPDLGNLPVPQDPSGSGKEATLKDVTLSDVKLQAQASTGKLKHVVQAVLCWSEYYNGKWQATKTSDLHDPARLGEFDLAGPRTFRRSDFELAVAPIGDALQIQIREIPGVAIETVYPWTNVFVLYNTHSLPLSLEHLGLFKPQRPENVYRDFHDLMPPFTIRHGRNGAKSKSGPSRHVILNNQGRFRVIQPLNDWSDVPFSPFFFSDSHGAYFVDTKEETWLFRTSNDYGLLPKFDWFGKVNIPHLVTIPNHLRPTDSILQAGDETNASERYVSARRTISRFVTEDAYIRVGLGAANTVPFGTKQIGLTGAVNLDGNQE